MYLKIKSIMNSAVTATNNIDANEYLRKATYLVYKNENMSNVEKLVYLKRIENIALARHLPT